MTTPAWLSQGAARASSRAGVPGDRVAAEVPTDAANGARLDPLVADPQYLLSASPPQLLAALPSVDEPAGVAAADAYRRAAARLRTMPTEHRPAYLQLAARCARAPELADTITARELPLAWTTPWASWRLQPPHLILLIVATLIVAVKTGLVDQLPVQQP